VATVVTATKSGFLCGACPESLKDLAKDKHMEVLKRKSNVSILVYVHHSFVGMRI
jgi:hypothetical protein